MTERPRFRAQWTVRAYAAFGKMAAKAPFAPEKFLF